MGHTERYGVRLRFECNRVTHLLHRDAGTACLRGARYAPTDPMESAKRALDGSQPVDGARELEPRTRVQNRHLGAPFSHRIRAHENNNVPQAARSRLAPVRWCRAALGGQAGCMAPPVARFAALASPGGGIEHSTPAPRSRTIDLGSSPAAFKRLRPFKESAAQAALKWARARFKPFNPQVPHRAHLLSLGPRR